MKKILLLGASGSIGTQTLDVVKHHSFEFEIIGLSVGYNKEKLIEILDSFSSVRMVCMAKEERYQTLHFC